MYHRFGKESLANQCFGDETNRAYFSNRFQLDYAQIVSR